MSKVSEHRKRLNLTQEQLADKANVSVRTIQRIEAGEALKGYTLEALVTALDVSREDLLADDQAGHTVSKRLLKLINISCLFLVFVPLASVLIPLAITAWKKAFTPTTKQIISIQILWTLLFPLVLLLAVFVGKVVGLNNHMLPLVILTMLFLNAYVIIRNAIELDRTEKLAISLTFSIL